MDRGEKNRAPFKQEAESAILGKQSAAKEEERAEEEQKNATKRRDQRAEDRENELSILAESPPSHQKQYNINLLRKLSVATGLLPSKILGKEDSMDKILSDIIRDLSQIDAADHLYKKPALEKLAISPERFVIVPEWRKQISEKEEWHFAEQEKAEMLQIDDIEKDILLLESLQEKDRSLEISSDEEEEIKRIMTSKIFVGENRRPSSSPHTPPEQRHFLGTDSSMKR